MELKCIYGINYDSNIYVINGEKPSIIDTGTGLHHKRVKNEIKKYIDIKKINQIILTHEHFDHTGGIEKLKNDTSEDVKIISHKKAATKIEKGESHFAKMLGAEMNCIPVNIKLEEGDTIQIGNKQWNVLYTPGHTPGSISLYEEISKSLISGDTIFSNGSFGRYDLPGGDPYLLKKSIERLSNLDIKNLYPGHENIVENYAKRHIEKTLQNINYML
jgi:glyoxylase-like metal-dependent hydrolase (beta-lactamase superfamily II)